MVLNDSDTYKALTNNERYMLLDIIDYYLPLLYDYAPDDLGLLDTEITKDILIKSVMFIENQTKSVFNICVSILDKFNLVQ